METLPLQEKEVHESLHVTFPIFSNFRISLGLKQNLVTISQYDEFVKRKAPDKSQRSFYIDFHFSPFCRDPSGTAGGILFFTFSVNDL